ncbi:hypothetical protein CUMW_128730 [Citrus unshiu]|nr:hypothetical protein CUMW_128730 [Citrus unshiu]
MQEHRPFLPHGFQFRPSDEELIEHYLKKKVSGIFIPLAEYFIRDCNLYEKKPSEIWDSHGGPFLNADEDLYFFTQLKKKSSKGSRIDRKVGSSGGTWQGEDAGKDIVSGQSKIKIGSKKRFFTKNKVVRITGLGSCTSTLYICPRIKLPIMCFAGSERINPSGMNLMKLRRSAKEKKGEGFSRQQQSIRTSSRY